MYPGLQITIFFWFVFVVKIAVPPWRPKTALFFVHPHLHCIFKVCFALFGCVLYFGNGLVAGLNDMIHEVCFRLCRRTTYSTFLRLFVAVGIFFGPVLVSCSELSSQCGEALQCSGMTAARREMIRARISTSSDFFQESCSSVIVGHALNYKPTSECENEPGHQDATALVKKLVSTCFSDAVTLISPARLCETHAQYLVSSFVWLNVLFVVTTVIMSEWIHYYD